ncbi:hypothetical protein Tco_1402282 [Tanacetum coccineum]
MSFNHDKYVVKSVKFVKKPSVKKGWRVKQVQQVWQATGKLFTNVGYQWQPTGRKFTLEEQCPLTRFTKSKVVPVKQPENVSTSEIVITERFSNTSQKPLTRTPTEIADPTFHTLRIRLFSNAGRTDRPLAFGLRLLKTYDGESLHFITKLIFEGVEFVDKRGTHRLYTSSLLNAACKKALNLLKKGLLIRGEAVEASKRRRSLLDHKIQQLSKGSSKGSGIILEVGKVRRSKSENKGIVPTEMELELEQIQQGSSHEVSNIRVIPKYHSEDRNPARANIKQALGSFQDQERYEHVNPQDTRSHDGERPQADDQRLDLADDLKEAQDHISSFSIDNEVLENLTKQVTLLAQQYKTQFPQTNNQLRTSSNKRNQATVQNGRVVVQNVQGRQNRVQGNNAMGDIVTRNGGAQNRAGNANVRQGKPIKCYNCNGIAVVVYYSGQDNEVDEDVDEPQVQDLALSVDNMFHDDDCDAFDSDVDEAPTAQTMFMANLSSADPVYDEASLSYDSDILSEVPDHDNYQDAVCEHHEFTRCPNDV